MTNRPDYLKQGEPARLFPVLAVTSKEGRTTSVVLACLSKIDDFGRVLIGSLGKRLGTRASVEAYTEIIFTGEKAVTKDRPDGLIVVRIGSREWRALVEAKVGNNDLKEEQIERYRALAKEHDIDAVVTISNQFSNSPENHPITEVRKSRSRIPVYHWSWMYILTTADLLLNNDKIQDRDQAVLLNELRRFLSHESAGVKGFDRMPGEWTELNKLVAAGGKIPLKSEDAQTVVGAWHQEMKDLALILTRQTETPVTEKLSRKHANDPSSRLKDDLKILCDENRLYAVLDIPDAAASLEIVADLSRRSIDAGMTLRAPEDKVSTKARMNWLCRQIKTPKISDINVRLNWPGRSEATQYTCADLIADPGLAENGKSGLQVSSFHIFCSKKLGARFTQQTNFIVDIEKIVPEFYKEVGQNLSAWRRAAPKIKESKDTADDVSITEISKISDF